MESKQTTIQSIRRNRFISKLVKFKNSSEWFISTIATAIEIGVSLIVLAAILIASYSLIKELGLFGGSPVQAATFDVFLNHALNLVIGLEFIKMLVRRTTTALIEVLSYAIARQLVVYHTTSLELLIGVLAIAALFAIRKYLYFNSMEEDINIIKKNKKI